MRLWSVANGAPTRTLEGHAQSVWVVAFSPDGQTLASGSDDDTVRLWSPATGAMTRRLAGHTEPTSWSVAWSPDGKTPASGAVTS